MTLTRRALLARGAALGAGAALGSDVAPGSDVALGADTLQSANAAGQSGPPAAVGDAQLLAELMQLEQLLVVTYREVLRSDQLPPRAARQLLAPYRHEREHVGTLARQLELASPGALPRARLTLPAARKLLAAHHVSDSLSEPRSGRDALRLLIAVENVAIGAYFRAISQLQSSAPLRVCAGIMASEAQHGLVLGELLHPREISQAAPDPFVRGSG